MSFEYDFPFNHLADSSFALAISELAHGPIHYNQNRLESLLFNPLLTQKE